MMDVNQDDEGEVSGRGDSESVSHAYLFIFPIGYQPFYYAEEDEGGPSVKPTTPAQPTLKNYTEASSDYYFQFEQQQTWYFGGTSTPDEFDYMRKIVLSAYFYAVATLKAQDVHSFYFAMCLASTIPSLQLSVMQTHIHGSKSFSFSEVVTLIQCLYIDCRPGMIG